MLWANFYTATKLQAGNSSVYISFIVFTQGGWQWSRSVSVGNFEMLWCHAAPWRIVIVCAAVYIRSTPWLTTSLALLFVNYTTHLTAGPFPQFGQRIVSYLSFLYLGHLPTEKLAVKMCLGKNQYLAGVRGVTVWPEIGCSKRIRGPLSALFDFCLITFLRVCE